MKEKTRCCHMCYSFQLTRVLLYASSHRQDCTYHSLCYTSRRALAGTKYSSMGSTWRIDPTTYRTMSEHSYHRATSRSPYKLDATHKQLLTEGEMAQFDHTSELWDLSSCPVALDEVTTICKKKHRGHIHYWLFIVALRVFRAWVN